MKKVLLPLTPPQLNIYAREITAPGTDMNNLFFIVKIYETVRIDLLSQAINLFIGQNEAVRTCIVDGAVPMQYVLPHREKEIELVDLCGQDYADIVTMWGQEPFVFYDSRLYDFKILKLDENTYGLYCKFHHIWCDGFATGLIWSGILTGYLGLLHGGIEENETLGIDVLQKNNAYTDEDEVFWEEYFKDLSLSEDYLSASERRNKSSDRMVFEIDAETTLMIKKFCLDHHIKPYIFFTAMMSLYQMRKCGGDDIVVGSLRLNRDTEEERKAVGMCVMDAPLRLKSNTNITFLELCAMVAGEAKKTSVHKKYPFTDTVEKVKSKQKIERSLLDFTVSYQKAKITTGKYRLSTAMWFGAPGVIADDLILHVLDLYDKNFTVFYDYKKSIYSMKQIEFLQAALMEMAHQVTENPIISHMNLLSPQEEAYLKGLETISGEVQINQTVLDMFAEVVEQNGNKKAVTGTGQDLTFSKLDKKSNKVANYLKSQGIKPDDIVIIMLPRGNEVVVAALGALKAGGAFCFVDPGFPQERIDYILSDSGAKCILTPNALTDAFKESEEFTPVSISPNSVAYAIYTSGTTGKPKGVLVEHKCLAGTASHKGSEMIKTMKEAGRATLAITSLSFDLSVIEIFFSLVNAITVVIATQKEIENIDLLAKKMAQNDVNTLIITPSRLMIYMDDSNFNNAMKNIDFLMVSGEAFIPELYEKIRSVNPGCRIYNCYGPSETFVTTYKEVTGGSVNLGIGFKNYCMYILDRNRNRLPFRAVGELYVGGIGVSRGYQNLPLEVAEKYIEFEGNRLYRTGDLVRFNDQGELDFFGRIDTQVKIRGLRVELADIESTITGFGSINSNTVILKDGCLIAFYTASEKISTDDLKVYLQGKLPYYMIPSAFVSIPVLPTTLNGKIDKKKLMEIPVELTRKSTPPRNDFEHSLCCIFEKVLNVRNVGIKDNFFEIGGNSLLAAKVIIEANARGLDLTYSDIFDRPTVLELGKHTQIKENVEHFDYSIFQDVLKRKEAPVKAVAYNHVLLTGATGFLGLHVLCELLENTGSTVYCMVRGRGNLQPEKRLKGLLFYYFSKSYDDLFGNRIIIIPGKVEDAPDMPELSKIELVINCAADVSHFTYGSAMYQVNVGLVKTLIEFCKSRKARLIQISTPGIGMFGIMGKTEKKEALAETDFYFGQDLTNAYVATKFMAEREVLLAAASGLNAGICRVGNLQGRLSDGEFQINKNSNAFQNTLKVYLKLGLIPESTYQSHVDYSPVDRTAEAIITLAMSNNSNVVEHVFADGKTPYSEIVECLLGLGYKLEVVSDKAYEKYVKEILNNGEKRAILTDIVDALTNNVDGHYEIGYECSHTSLILKELGFAWQKTSREYINKCLQAVSDLGIFE